MLSPHHSSSLPLTMSENQIHPKEAQYANTPMKVHLRMLTGSLDIKTRLSHKAREIFFSSDIWPMGSLISPNCLWILWCWYHLVAVSSTAKACTTRAAFGNFWAFKRFAYWFATCCGTRWRETTDSFLYQVSLFCFLLQCYLFNSFHYSTHF